MSVGEKNNFAVIAKPVGSRCNMKCRYCYYLDKGKYSTHKKQSKMSSDILESLIRQSFEANSGPVVSFTWHGGEPTMAGIDFYKKVVDIQKKYLPEGWQVWNSLQTNGILINNEWAKFIRQNNFDVGLSVDGDELTHNKNRVDRSGKPTYEKVKRACEILLKNGTEADILCTVTAETQKSPLEVYRSLRDLGTGWIQFIPVIVMNDDGTVNGISATSEGYGKFLCAVFDEWAFNDLGKTDVQLFAEFARIRSGGEAALCYMSPVCGNVLIAEEDGGIYSCDHFVDDNHRLGMLPEDDLSEMAGSELQKAFGHSKTDSLTKKCRECEYLKYCYGGCLKDRFAETEDGESGQYYLCGAMEMFFSHADKIMDRIMTLSSQKNPPSKIMEILKAEFC